MLLVLALCAQTATSGVGLLDDGPGLGERGSRAVRLAEADAAAPGELSARIEALNARIRATHTEWPGGAVALTAVGFVVSLLILPGLPLTIFGAIAGPSGLFGFGAVFLVIGVGILAVGLLGLAAGVVGVVIGRHASERARLKRQRLIDERDLLQRQLERAPVPPPGVWRSSDPSAGVTVAVF